MGEKSKAIFDGSRLPVTPYENRAAAVLKPKSTTQA